MARWNLSWRKTIDSNILIPCRVRLVPQHSDNRQEAFGVGYLTEYNKFMASVGSFGNLNVSCRRVLRREIMWVGLPLFARSDSIVYEENAVGRRKKAKLLKQRRELGRKPRHPKIWRSQIPCRQFDPCCFLFSSTGTIRNRRTTPRSLPV